MFKLYFRNNVIACAKHFVGDGGTEKGVNEGNTILSYEDLERIHMAPYVDCIAKGVSTIMVSYSSWNGNKLHGHHFLLNEILKEKLGFKVDFFFSKTCLVNNEIALQVMFIYYFLVYFLSYMRRIHTISFTYFCLCSREESFTCIS